MVTEDQYRLITAAIDNEIDAADAGALARLLATSAAARELHDQLLHDRALLRNLSRPTLPANFTAQVLSRLPKLPRTASPVNWNYLFSPNGLMVSSHLTTAAAVLLLVLFSFGFLYGLKHHEQQAVNRLPSVDAEVARPVDGPALYQELPEIQLQSASHQPTLPSGTVPIRQDLPLTAPFLRPEIPHTDVTSYRGALLFTSAELGQAIAQKRVERELTAESFHELELFAGQPTAVGEELTRLATAAGVTVVTIVPAKAGMTNEVILAIGNTPPKTMVQLLRQLTERADVPYCSLKPITSLDARRSVAGVPTKYRELFERLQQPNNLQSNTLGQLDRFLTQRTLAPTTAPTKLERAVLIVLRTKG